MVKKGMIINMNEAIIVELEFFVVSILWGGIIIAFYDCLRIIRKVIKHNGFFIALEDVLYWVVSSLLIFNMMYKQNNGIIRTFSILAMFIGMMLYYNLLSELLVEKISFILIKIKKIVKKLKKVAYIKIKRLKNKVKSSKILLSGYGEGDLFEEKKK